jgi:hypothetical protein
VIPAGNSIAIRNVGWRDFRHIYRAMIDELHISLEEKRTLVLHEHIAHSVLGISKAETDRAANGLKAWMLRKA